MHTYGWRRHQHQKESHTACLESAACCIVEVDLQRVRVSAEVHPGWWYHTCRQAYQGEQCKYYHANGHVDVAKEPEWDVLCFESFCTHLQENNCQRLCTRRA